MRERTFVYTYNPEKCLPKTILRIVVSPGLVSLNSHWLCKIYLKTGSFYYFKPYQNISKVEIKRVFRYPSLNKLFTFLG